MKLNKVLLEEWIERNTPLALEKLAVKSGLSFTTLSALRRGRIPSKFHNRQKLADALGVSVDELFPVGAGKKAS